MILRQDKALGRRVALSLGMCGVLLIVPFVLLHPSRHARQAWPASTRISASHKAGGAARTRPGGSQVSFLAWVDSAAPAAVLVSNGTTSPAPSPGLVAPTTTLGAPAAGQAADYTRAPAPADPLTYPPAPTHAEVGPASWYAARVGSCAHPYLPFGTVIQITDLNNGRRAKCVVDDRGPYVPGRIIDLSKSVFAELAPTTSGVIEVRLGW
ncbi:MAG: septal ring lytic transglycosylase RlpA family protein [Acidimicrobiales bacterium]